MPGLTFATLVDGVVVPVESMEDWVAWSVRAGGPVVLASDLGESYLVSTIFLGISVRGDLSDVFETMVFRLSDDASLEQIRCGSEEEALRCHQSMLSIYGDKT